MNNSSRRGPVTPRRRSLVLGSLAVAAMTLVAPTPAFAVDTTSSIDSTAVAVAPAEPASTLRRVSEHVVVISIDGLRPDAIGKFGARTLQKLMREGAYTLKAQTILPSKTLPSHTSMVTGVDVDQHGVNWNSEQMDEHGVVTVPTMFGEARNAGLETAAFFSKTKFHHLEVPNTIDYSRSPQHALFGRWLAGHTVGEVEKYLKSDAAAPNLLFVHIGEPDYVGHVLGWMSPWYGEAVREADAAVARIIDEAGERFGAGNFTVIVTADHGGHDRTHGSDDPRDTTIPWITWGKGVQPGTVIENPVRTMDTASTALWLLGIAQPQAWEGLPVALAFGTPTQVVTE